MNNTEEVLFAFKPVDQLSQVQKIAIMKAENGFADLATEIIGLTPNSADRTSCLRKLLDAKFTCIQAITHYKEKVNAPQKS